MFVKIKKNIFFKDYWLGGIFHKSEGDWRWATSGKVFTIHNFSPRQPNNLKEHDCLVIRHNLNFLWDYRKCSDQNRFYCERQDTSFDDR